MFGPTDAEAHIDTGRRTGITRRASRTTVVVAFCGVNRSLERVTLHRVPQPAATSTDGAQILSPIAPRPPRMPICGLCEREADKAKGYCRLEPRAERPSTIVETV